MQTRLLTPESTRAIDPQRARALRHVLRDGAAVAFMGGVGEAHFAAHALFLGATALQQSVLAALPPLFGAAAQFAAVSLEQRLGRRRLLMLTGTLLQALVWLPLVWLPYAFPSHPISALLGCLLLYYVCFGLSAPLWANLLGELIPAASRGRFFARRARGMSVAGFFGLIAAGAALQLLGEHDRAQLAFLLMFAAAGAARLWSAYHVAQVAEAAPIPAAGAAPRFADPRFVRFCAFTAAIAFAVAIAAPFFTAYMLTELRFSYLELTAATGVFALTQFFTLPAWGRLADRYGNRAVLRLAGLALPLLPLLWLPATGFVPVLLLQALGGWFWSGFALALGSYLHDATPQGSRAPHLAWHHLASTLGAAAGALLGGVIHAKLAYAVELFGRVYSWRGIAAVLLVSSCARALVLLFYLPRLEEPRRVRRVPSTRRFFAMLRCNALATLIVSRRRGAARDRLDA